MMRRGAGFNADQAGWQLLKECQHVTPLELTTDDDIASRIDAVNLKDRLRDVETECRDRLHVWLLRIVGALTAPTSMALTCRGGAVHSIKSGQAIRSSTSNDNFAHRIEELRSHDYNA